MILLDTNVLVALVDERDRLHARAARDLNKLSGPFGVMSAVLAETCFLLEAGYLRQRLSLLLERIPATAIELEAPWWGEVFTWLHRYADHDPDLCDALLVTQSHRIKAAIWTYDSDFKTVWRNRDGKKPTLVGSTR